MDLVETFKRWDLERIEESIRMRQEEHLTLDFTTVAAADLSDKNDKRSFAKTLSAFANSSGGIIVWGVLAKRSGADQADCACDKRPIANLPLLLSRLSDFTGHFVQPVVEGILHRPISTEPRGGSGFAVTLVPESAAGPHMAKAGEDRYFKRSGGATYKMEHFDVEDMFGRRRKPRIDLVATVRGHGESSGPEGVRCNGKVILCLRNEGRGSAKSILVSLRLRGPPWISSHGVDGNSNEGLPRLKLGRPVGEYAYGGDLSIVIHPGVTFELAAIDFVLDPRTPSVPDVEIAYEISAEDMPLRRDRLHVPGSQIVEELLAMRGKHPG